VEYFSLSVLLTSYLPPLKNIGGKYFPAQFFRTNYCGPGGYWPVKNRDAVLPPGSVLICWFFPNFDQLYQPLSSFIRTLALTLCLPQQNHICDN
jgi:hypothetical protein